MLTHKLKRVKKKEQDNKLKLLLCLVRNNMETYSSYN